MDFEWYNSMVLIVNFAYTMQESSWIEGGT